MTQSSAENSTEGGVENLRLDQPRWADKSTTGFEDVAANGIQREAWKIFLGRKKSQLLLDVAQWTIMYQLERERLHLLFESCIIKSKKGGTSVFSKNRIITLH